MTVAMPVSEPDPWCTAKRHGSMTARVNDGCKCQVTRDLAARYQRERDLDALRGIQRRVHPIGTIRRLQALVRAGWTQTEIATAASSRGGTPISAKTIGHMLQGTGATKFVHRSTARRIQLAYDLLSMKVPPDTSPYVAANRRRIRRAAEEKGFAQALEWDDDTIDDPKARPRNPKQFNSHKGPMPIDMAAVLRLVDEGKRAKSLTHAEAQKAYDLLRERGFSLAAIEHDYGLKPERYGATAAQRAAESEAS